MKKIFTYMMMFVAVAMFTTSCGDDEDNFDYEAAIKNLTGNFWEGYNTEQYKEWGGFVDKGDRNYVVIRFDRSAAAAMNERQVAIHPHMSLDGNTTTDMAGAQVVRLLNVRE